VIATTASLRRMRAEAPEVVAADLSEPVLGVEVVGEEVGALEFEPEVD